jgi:hypothetical protein
MKRSKAYNEVAQKVDADKLYGPVEALEFAKANAKAKFDETVDVSMRLGIDTRKADQMVRGTVNLPTRSVRTSSSPRSPAATSTSTPSSPPRTLWARSAVSAACSVRVASCRTRRPGP